jgi:hypothetical protein
MRNSFASADYASARDQLQKLELEKKEKYHLLQMMEEIRLYYAEKNWAQASQRAQQALDLMERQYTKSITKEGSKWFLNDSSGEFFGAVYERSWVYYHLCFSELNRHRETGKREHLFAARAALLGWDSFFQNWSRQSQGKTRYPHDLVAKVTAALVHETIDQREDLQIALQLYKDAFKLLEQLSPQLSYFSSSPEAFKRTQRWLQIKMASLTLQVRAYEKNELTKQFQISPEVWKIAQESLTKNVTFVIEQGVVAAKVAKMIDLGLKGLAKMAPDQGSSQVIAQVGAEVLAYFAYNTLGLAGAGGSLGAHMVSYDLLKVAAHEAAISFEVPVIEPQSPPQSYLLRLTPLQNKTNAKSKILKLVTLLDVRDIADLSVQEEAELRVLRTGIRVGMKHFAAIAAAYGIYESMKKNNELLGKMSAIATYVAATKGIALTERADTRSWSTLPQSLQLGETALAPGEYKVELQKKTSAKGKSSESEEINGDAEYADIGSIQVKPSKKTIFSLTVPQL